MSLIRFFVVAVVHMLAVLPSIADDTAAALGVRPHYLVSTMGDSPLKMRLASCLNKPAHRSDFSISHRGAPLQFPEHTLEGYRAAIAQGAGVVECDVTFTKDKALVCRHSQCDLHTTTNILATPLARECSVPPVIKNGKLANAADIKCCTSDITVAQFKSLRGKMDAANLQASTVEEYMQATPPWRTDLYAGGGTLMTHRESIALFKAAGVKMTPELKGPAVTMPYKGMSQSDYAANMLKEYIDAGVRPEQVFPQSFHFADIVFWLKHYPDFGRQAVALDGRYSLPEFDHNKPASWQPSMQALADAGVRYLAPPMWMLLDKPKKGQRPEPSIYAREARKAGLELITWTIERSPPLSQGLDWYTQPLQGMTFSDGDILMLLDVLARDVGVVGVFSDWPATTSFYASCSRATVAEK